MARTLSRRTTDEGEERDAQAPSAEEDTTPARRTTRRTEDAPSRTRPGGPTRPAGRSSILTRIRSEGGSLAALSEEIAPKRDFDAERVTLGPDVQVMKFMEKLPYDVYRQHWVAAAPKRKSFMCLGLEDGCPICAYDLDIAAKKGLKAVRPSLKTLWNVVVLSGDIPTVRKLEAGAILFDQILGWSEQDRTNPINKPGLYWGISRRKVEKSGQDSYVFAMEPIRDTMLELSIQDGGWELTPLTAEELTDLEGKLFTEDDSQSDSYDDLVELIDGITSSRTR